MTSLTKKQKETNKNSDHWKTKFMKKVEEMGNLKMILKQCVTKCWKL